MRPGGDTLILKRIQQAVFNAVTGVTNPFASLARACQQAGEAFEQFKLAADKASQQLKPR